MNKSCLFVSIALSLFLLSCSLAGNKSNTANGGTTGGVTLSGTITGNVFGKKLGVVLMTVTVDSNYNQIMIGSNSSAPTTASSFSYSVNAAVNSGCYLYYAIYEDQNGNNGYDAFDTRYISSSAQPYTTASVTFDASLVGKVLNGTISGADANLFSNICINYCYLPITGTSFSVQYYVLAGSMQSNSVYIWQDFNGNNNMDTSSGESYVLHTNQIYVVGNTLSTNTLDFTLQKTTNYFTIHASSDEYANMVFLRAGAFPEGKACTNYYYRFSGGPIGVQAVYILNDLDTDNTKDGNESWISFPVYISNGQSLISMDFVVKRTIINMNFTAGYASYSGPKVHLNAAHGYVPDSSITASALTITNYCVTNSYFYMPYWSIDIYNDANNNGYYDYGTEYYIAYNDAYWTNYVATTNITFTISN